MADCVLGVDLASQEQGATKTQLIFTPTDWDCRMRIPMLEADCGCYISHDYDNETRASCGHAIPRLKLEPCKTHAKALEAIDAGE